MKVPIEPDRRDRQGRSVSRRQRFPAPAFPGASVRQAGEFVLLVRSGALPGAADWSHAEANAASAANGVLNMPNLTGGCTCNFAPASVACVPAEVVRRGGAE